MKIPSVVQRVRALPLSSWVVLGFAISYAFFFVVPIFLTTNVMQFYRYVPAAEHIGIDLKQTLSFSAYWLAPDQMSYVRSNTYPPVASLLFVPLLGLKFSVAYQILTGATVLAYALAVLLLVPALLPEKQSSSLPILICAAGLVSYGLQFELERGQFDVLAMLPALLALWIFHRHAPYSWAAYVLFSLSVQLKLYPLIFVILFVRDWGDLLGNVRRLLLIVAANAALFMALGTGIFASFTNAAQVAILDPFVWVGNHSIRSAVVLALHFADRHGWAWLDPYSVLIQVTLLIVVLACLLLIVLQAYRRKATGLQAPLFLACTIGALLIPPVSHDYRLTILAAPVLMVLLMEVGPGEAVQAAPRFGQAALILLFSFAYSSTLFPYVQKPFFLANNFPALFAMLLSVTALSFLPKSNAMEPIQ